MIMPDSSHPFTAISTPKRSACDRCRGHKLRCPRRESTAQSCSRCIRLGVYCATSFQRPLGHSRNNLPGNSRRLSKPEPRPTSVEIEDSKLIGTMQMPLPEMPSLPVREYEYLSIPIHGLHHPSDVFDPKPLNAFSPPDSQCPGSDELDVDDKKYSIIGESLMDLEYWPVPDDDSNLLSESTPLDTVRVHNRIPTQAPCILQCDGRLSRLILRLSDRLEEHPPGPNSRYSSPETLVSELSEQWDSQYVGDILRDTADFISIVESYSHDETPLVGTSSIKSCLGTVVHLEILSAYLLIVATFGNLLHNLCSRFSINNSPTTSPSSTQSQYFVSEQATSLPAMEVAGFQVQHSMLQSKLLLETVIYQLAQMEQLLGLPQSWRATDKRGYQGVGLFHNRKALLDAIRMSNPEQSSDALGGSGELSAVASLRGHIRTLRSFLD